MVRNTAVSTRAIVCERDGTLPASFRELTDNGRPVPMIDFSKRGKLPLTSVTVGRCPGRRHVGGRRSAGRLGCCTVPRWTNPSEDRQLRGGHQVVP